MVEAGAAFATEFDAPFVAARLPASITSGFDPTLRLTDGIRRDDDRIGTCTRAAMLLGLATEPHQPVRVEMDVAWSRPGTKAALVELRSGPAKALFLVPSRATARPSRTVTIGLDVPASEIPEGGLLLIEILDGAAHLPASVRQRLRSSGPRAMSLLEMRLSAPPDGAGDPSAPGTWVADGMALVHGRGETSMTLEGRLHQPRRGQKDTGPADGSSGEVPQRVLRRPPPRGFFAEQAKAKQAPPRQAGRASTAAEAVLRKLGRFLPLVAQRWLVAANLRVLGRDALRRIAAIDAESGAPVAVAATVRGSRIMLRVAQSTSGAVIVDVRPSGGSALVGCGARWIEWTPVA